jgi:hypothetical protein
MRRRTWWVKTARIVGAKLAIAVALTVGDGRQRPGNYWLLDAPPGIEPGAPVAMSGVIAGRVVAKKEHGDTTFLRVVFTAEVNKLPRDRILLLQRVGLEGLVALELASSPDAKRGPVERGGELRVIFETPPTDSRSVGSAPRPSDELWSPPVWRPIPPGPAAPLGQSLLST